MENVSSALKERISSPWLDRRERLNVLRRSEKRGKVLLFVNITTALTGILLWAALESRWSVIVGAALALGVHFYFSRWYMINPAKGIPVLTFHSISDHPRWLPWP